MPPRRRTAAIRRASSTTSSLIGFASALSTRAVDPIVPPIAQGLAVDPGTVALLTTAFALPFAIVQPILGPIADMIGKVRLMMICLAVITVASLACAFTTSFPDAAGGPHHLRHGGGRHLPRRHGSDRRHVRPWSSARSPLPAGWRS